MIKEKKNAKYYIFGAIGKAAKNFLTCGDSVGSSGCNEEMFYLVTLIYHNLGKGQSSKSLFL